MRLKRIRDSVEDIEYVEILKRLGRGDWALQVVRTVAADWVNWTRDPNALESARRQLGQVIDRLTGGAVVVGVSVSPSAPSLMASQSQQFSATVSGSGNTAVTWSLSPATGSITAAGLYTAPSSIDSNLTVTVTATSMADPNKSGRATVSLHSSRRKKKH